LIVIIFQGGSPMALMIVALLLFVALVASWVVLPGSAMAASAQETTDPMPAGAASQTA
jgi:hypothetical protein